MARRLFDFPGDKDQYITFLESELMKAKPFLNLDPVGPSKPGPSQTERFHFIEYRPQAAGHARPGPPDEGSEKWRRQLCDFISAIPGEADWGKARTKAGIDVATKNQQAMLLMLGHTSMAIFNETRDVASLNERQVAILPYTQRLIAKGCEYGNFMVHCRDDRNFAVTVTAFQKLIFVSYSVVVIRAGVPKDITDDMMRSYTGDQNEGTLEKYRSGALWANRCMAALLANGWGHKSWEIFLLGTG